MPENTWLPADFIHPERVQLTADVHIRPIRAADVDIDMIAVLGNQQMLWSIYGEAWGWPPATMTREQDEEDLAHHVDEIERHISFNYAILNADESALLGCIYIYPVEPDCTPLHAEVSWWVVEEAPAEVRDSIDAKVPDWVENSWPFTEIVYPFNER